MRKFAVFLIIATSLVYSIEGDRLDDMNWEPGDIITCLLPGDGGFLGFEHYMIGSDIPEYVITTMRNGTDGRIVDIHHSWYTRGINRSECTNKGKGKLTRLETVQRANSWLGKKFFFNIRRCNSQHWTNYWANGSSGKWCDNQSLQTTASYCPI